MRILHSTPWGPPQYQRVIADGIIEVSTAGHGGLWLSDERWAELTAAFPAFSPWGGNTGWLEEDCDYCYAVLLWPDLFDGLTVWNVVKSASGGYVCKALPAGWFGGPGRRVVAIANLWEKQNAHLWQACGGSSCAEGWQAWLQRIGDGKRMTRIFASYPRQSLWTDAELEAESTPEPIKIVPEAPKRQEEAIACEKRAVTFNEADCGGVFDGVGTVYSDADPGL